MYWCLNRYVWLAVICIVTAASSTLSSQLVTSYDWIMEEHESSIVIGHEEDPEDRFFGDLTDVLVDGNHIYTLDRDRHQLAVDVTTGERVYESGSEGRGPGEFMSPSRLFKTPDGHIGILEAYGRQSFFTTPAHSVNSFGFSYSERLIFESEPKDICFSEETVYAYVSPQGVSDQEENDHVILRMDPPYEVPDYFGRLPSHLDDFEPEYHSLMTAGRLHCMGDDRIIAVHAYSNEVDIYKDGVLQHTVSIPNLKPTSLSVDTFDGRPYVGIDPNDSHSPVSTVSLENDDMLVQYRYTPDDWHPNREHSPFTYDTFVLNVENGTVASLGTTDRIFHAIDGNGYVAQQTDPFPTIHIVHRNDI